MTFRRALGSGYEGMSGVKGQEVQEGGDRMVKRTWARGIGRSRG